MKFLVKDIKDLKIGQLYKLHFNYLLNKISINNAVLFKIKVNKYKERKYCFFLLRTKTNYWYTEEALIYNIERHNIRKIL